MTKMLFAFGLRLMRRKWVMRHLLPSQAHRLRIQDVIKLVSFLLLSLLTSKPEDFK